MAAAVEEVLCRRPMHMLYAYSKRIGPNLALHILPSHTLRTSLTYTAWWRSRRGVWRGNLPVWLRMPDLAYLFT